MTDLAITALPLQQLLSDWYARRGTAMFPARREFDIADFRYILGYISLIEIRHDPQDLFFRVCGSQVATRLGVDLTGKSLAGFLEEDEPRRIETQLKRSIVERRPVAELRHPTLWADNQRWSAEILVLPLAHDGSTIDKLFLAYSFF